MTDKITLVVHILRQKFSLGKRVNENFFKRLITCLVLLAFVNQNLAFATHQILELDVQGSQTPQRLHTILPSYKIADVSHVEIDADKQQVAVYRKDEANLRQEDKDPSGVHSDGMKRQPVIIPTHDVQNLPWNLETELLKSFLLQHTAWLNPLGEDGYKLEFRGALLGGMKKGGGQQNIYHCSKAPQTDPFCWTHGGNLHAPNSSWIGSNPGNISLQSNPNYTSGSGGVGFNTTSFQESSKIMQLSNQQTQFFQDQRKKEEAWRNQPIGLNLPTLSVVQSLYQPSVQTTIIFPSGHTSVVDTSVPEKYREPIPTGHSLQDEYNTLKYLYDMADWRQWWEIYEEAQKRGVKNTVCNIYDFRKRYEKGLGFSIKDFMSVKEQEALQYEASQRLKTEQQENPVFYGEYSHFKEIHRLINTVIYPKVFEYSDPLGYDRAFVRAIDWKKSYTFVEYLQTYNPVFYDDYTHFKEIHRLINSVIWPKVFEYSDPLGYDQGFIKSLANTCYKAPMKPFEGYLQAYNPFYQEYTQLKEIHRLINSVIWPKVFEYSDPLGYDQRFIKSLADTYYKKPMKLFEGYLQEHNPFYQEYTQLKEIHRLINSVIWPKVFEYSDPLRYDQGFIKSLANTYYKAPMKPFEGYMTEVFDDQVLEDWGAKNWRDVFRPEEGEPQIMQVGLFKEVLKLAPPTVKFIQKGWQKAVQVYKGDLVKGLKIDKKTLDKLPKELGDAKISRDTKGLRWGDDNNGIRIMKGNPKSQYPHQQVDYVRITSNGKVVDKKGIEIPGTEKGLKTKEIPDVHISLEEYRSWKQWNKP